MVRRRRGQGWLDGFDLPPDDDAPKSRREVPIVFWRPIACPACGSRRRNDTHRRAGRLTSWHRCLECGASYKAIIDDE